MGMNPEELAEWQSDLQRLDRARTMLRERGEEGKTDDGRRRKRYIAPGSGEDKSGGEPVDGGKKRRQTRARSSEGNSESLSGTPGRDAGSLESGGTEQRSRFPHVRRHARNTGGASSSGGQAAGQEESLFPLKAEIASKLKRALTYAGFDLAGDAEALTPTEQEFYLPKVAQFFVYLGAALDWSLTHANARHEESDIWTFTDEEATKLAQIYLKRAAHIGWMAQVARQVEHLQNVGDAKDVAQILGKRMVASGMFIGSNGGLELWLR